MSTCLKSIFTEGQLKIPSIILFNRGVKFLLIIFFSLVANANSLDTEAQKKLDGRLLSSLLNTQHRRASLMISNGANVHATINGLPLVFHIVKKHKNPLAALMFLEDRKVNLKVTLESVHQNINLAYTAYLQGHTKVVEYLWKNKILDPNFLYMGGNTLALNMILQGDLQGLEMFVKHGGNLQLHSKHINLLQEVTRRPSIKNKLEIAKFLVEHGVEGLSVLEKELSFGGKLEKIKLLLDAGVAPTRKLVRIAKQSRNPELSQLVQEAFNQARPSRCQQAFLGKPNFLSKFRSFFQ